MEPSTAIQAFAYAVIAICLAGLSGLLVELRACWLHIYSTAQEATARISRPGDPLRAS